MFLEQQMVSEGSCDTEYYMLKIQLCHYKSKLHLNIQIERSRKKIITLYFIVRLCLKFFLHNSIYVYNI